MRAVAACLLAAACACGTGGSEKPTLYPDDPVLQWSQPIGPTGVGKPRRVSPPAIGVDGTVYVGGSDPERRDPPVACLYAFHPDGTLWRKVCGSEGDHRGAPGVWTAASPTGKAGYGVDESGGVYAIRSDGETTHLRLPDAPAWGADPILVGPIAMVDENRFYVGGAGAIYLIDTSDALSPVKWSFRAESQGAVGTFGTTHVGIYYAAVGPDGRIYASGPKLHVFNSAGVRLWETKTGGGTEGGPAFGYESNLVLRMHRGIVGVSPAGRVVWEHDPGEEVLGAPRLDRRGNVYFTAERSVRGVNQIGTPRWSIASRYPFTGPVVLRNDTLYCTDTGGDVHAVGLDGVEKWTVSVGHWAASPAVDTLGTSLYVTTDEPRVYALRPPL